MSRESTSTDFTVVGNSIDRIDAAGKLNGRAAYAADIKRPGMLHLRAVRSPYARARVRGIDTSPARAVPGVIAVLTAADIPGQNRLGPRSVEKDQPVLVEEMVGFAGEAVAVVAAETPEAAASAAELVQVSYEPLEPVVDPVAALLPESPQIHPRGKLCHEMHITRGDYVAAEAGARLVLTNSYITPFVDHAYLEPDAVVAEPTTAGLLIWAPTLNVYSDRKEAARVLNLDPTQIRIMAGTVGGNFGGKPDLPAISMAALVALKTGRPARIVFDRQEVIVATTKRHPYRMKYTHAVAADGTLLGIKADILADAGAYIGFSESVVSKGLVHATGPYRVPNVDLRIRAVFTNQPVTVGMRGYGVPQVAFGSERQMDQIAKRLGIDPFELRIKNALRAGDATATGQVIENINLVETMLAAKKIAETEPEALPNEPHVRRSWGIAAFYYGCGRTGVADESKAYICVEPDGFVHVFVGCPDVGQGSDTAMTQIAAEAMGLPFEMMRMTSADTELTPDSGATGATRVTYVVGNAVKRAATALREFLLDVASEKEGHAVQMLPADRCYLATLRAYCEERGIKAEVLGDFKAPSKPLDALGQGAPYGSYTCGIQITKVQVDMETGKVDVDRIISCYDVGTVVNPKSLHAQIEGGAAMTLGYARTEQVMLNRGITLNPNLHTYMLPTAVDMAPIQIETVESFEESGPFGAKGIGEPSCVPGAASIANAISTATGKEFNQIPITPEMIVSQLEQADHEDKETQ